MRIASVTPAIAATTVSTTRPDSSRVRGLVVYRGAMPIYEELALSAIDEAIWHAYMAGDVEAMDRYLDQRIELVAANV